MPNTISSKPSSATSAAGSTRAHSTASTHGIASCVKPRNASQPRSPAVAWNGQASGSVTALEISAPSSTAGTRSIGSPCAWLRCTTVQFTAAAMGTPSATMEPSHCVALFASPAPRPSCPTNIHAMPRPPTTMAAQVRAGKRWPVTTRAISAVSSGPSAMVTSTRATPVIVSATIKAVNITAQHTPDSQNVPRRHGSRANTPGPCHSGRMTSSDSALKALRQNVTSNPCATCSCRVTTPAVDHSSVASTIIHAARA